MPRPVDVGSPEFASELATRLREARAGRRRRNFVRPPLTARDLRAAERGALPLTPRIVNALADRYGLDLGSLFPARTPLTIGADGVLVAGGERETFTAGDEATLFEAYVRLVHRLRGAEVGEVVVLRAADIAELANELNCSYLHVLTALAERMEIGEDDRLAMADMLVSGAGVVGLL